MLRSSSTPVLGSLLSSKLCDTPSELTTTIHHTHHNKLPYHTTTATAASGSFLSCNSSPISTSINNHCHSNHKGGGFRRVQSEGNLEFVANNNNHSPFAATRPRSMAILDSIPSFSFHNGEYDDEEDDGSEVDLHRNEEMDDLVRNSERVSSVGNFGGVVLDEKKDGVCQEVVYLAKGLGIPKNGGHGVYEGGSGDGNRGSGQLKPGGGRGDGHGLEDYYKKMVEENPGNSLFLRNYAQFLHQVIQIVPR